MMRLVFLAPLGPLPRRYLMLHHFDQSQGRDGVSRGVHQKEGGNWKGLLDHERLKVASFWGLYEVSLTRVRTVFRYDGIISSLKLGHSYRGTSGDGHPCLNLIYLSNPDSIDPGGWFNIPKIVGVP